MIKLQLNAICVLILFCGLFLRTEATYNGDACGHCMQNLTYPNMCEIIAPTDVAAKKVSGGQLVDARLCIHCDFFRPCACNLAKESKKCAQTCEEGCLAIYTCDATYLYLYDNYCNKLNTLEFVERSYTETNTTSEQLPAHICEKMEKDLLYKSRCMKEQWPELINADYQTPVCIKIKKNYKTIYETRPSKYYALREACENQETVQIVPMEHCDSNTT